MHKSTGGGEEGEEGEGVEECANACNGKLEIAEIGVGGYGMEHRYLRNGEGR